MDWFSEFILLSPNIGVYRSEFLARSSGHISKTGQTADITNSSIQMAYCYNFYQHIIQSFRYGHNSWPEIQWDILKNISMNTSDVLESKVEI